MNGLKETQKKIMLLGDGAVGKTSLIRKFVVDKFDDKYIATIGTKVTAKGMKISMDDDPHYLSISGAPLGALDKFQPASVVYLTLQIWDILGQKGYSKLHQSIFRGTDGVLMVADVTRKETLKSLEDYWIPEVQNLVGEVPFIVLVNKSDLIKEAELTDKNLKEFAAKYKVPFYLTSAKNGENVKRAFYVLGKRMLELGEVDRKKTIKSKPIKTEKSNFTELIDRIIDDFCTEYGKIEDAMPVLRKQFEIAEFDINKPTIASLKKAVERLTIIEMKFKKKEIAESNRAKRMGWIKEFEQ